MTLSVGSTPFDSLDGQSVTFDGIAAQALADWNAAGIGPFQDHSFFSFAAAPVAPFCVPDGVNVVAFRTTQCDGFGWGDAIAVTRQWLLGGRTVEADVLFNANVVWNYYTGPLRTDQGTAIHDFYRAAALSFGHVIDLEHEDDVPSIMGSTISDIDRLQADDVAGAHAVQYSPFGVAALLQVSPDQPVDFGTVAIGLTGERAVTLHNLGGAPLVGSATTTGPFSCVAGCDYDVGVGDTIEVIVRFTPTASGPAAGSIGFTGGGGATVDLTGRAPADPALVTLTIAHAGTGSGTVAAASLSISCPATCATVLLDGHSLTLAATAQPGSVFVGWQGPSCSGTRRCAVTMNGDTTITATFVARTPSSIALVAAVLPSSRSVQVGAVATAFATIINLGPEAAAYCQPSLATDVPAEFAYQTTDPATNRVVGTADTPVAIPVGAAQSFVFAVAPTAPFPPTELELTFDCANAARAPVTVGLNTLLLSASSTPVPDVVALGATLSFDGIVDVAGARGTGVFSVAVVNVGVADVIVATVDTGAVPVPVSLAICETDPASGICLAAPGPTVTTRIDAGATPTFGIFVQGAGVVPFDPAANRIFVRFRDAGGVTRGSTSVAVRTR